jgi:hypothetical protein
MSTNHSRRTIPGVVTTIALLVSTPSVGRAEHTDRLPLPQIVPVSITAPTVELAGRCDLHSAIATVRVHAQNRGFVPSLPKTIRVLDSAHALAGETKMSAIGAHESRAIDVPLSLGTAIDPVPATGPAAIAGAHTFRVYLSDVGSDHTRLVTAMADVSTTIPSTFCAAAIALAAPTAPASAASVASAAPASSPAPAASAKSQSSNFSPQILTSSRAKVLFGVSAQPLATPTANPGKSSSNVAARAQPFALATPFRPDSVTLKRGTPLTLVVGVPQGLRAASGVGDCAVHAPGTPLMFGPSSCASMLASGDLVLVWDAPADASVDGYHVYSLNGTGSGAVNSTIKGRLRTLANLPPVSSAFPQCYVVAATRGSAESAAGSPFCASEKTSTRTLGTTYARGVKQDHSEKGGLGGIVSDSNVPDGGPVVGYFHAKNESTFGDTRFNKVRRYAVAFDLDALRNKRLVSARLHLTIQSSYGAGNNHSCASSVASGVEFWWKSDAQQWIEGSFDVARAPFNVTGPIVTADVTKLVAPILAGSPNYGFVIRNDDENLGAFENSQCETVYTNPQLELVYYN